MLRRRLAALTVLLAALLAGCVLPAPVSAPYDQPFRLSGGGDQPAALLPQAGTPSAHSGGPAGSPAKTPVLPSPTPFQPPTHAPNAVIPTPTPDQPLQLPTPRSAAETYVVKAGDALGKIAARFGVSLTSVIAANPGINPDLLYVGTALTIPAPLPGDNGPDFKIIPDSELVYGPHAAGFDVAAFVNERAAYLAQYSEDVEGVQMTGSEIVERVAHDYSVNPRLLLAVLEYQSGWVTRSNPAEASRDFPIGVRDSWRKGLYHQLAWAADNLNYGFYLWRTGGVGAWILGDGTAVPVSPVINAGTAGVEYFFSSLTDRASWMQAVGPEGLYATYSLLFGPPFDYALEPLTPSDLQQPALQLPFEPGDSWSFTGGPHGGWGSGSAWSALDFAPPGEALGCYTSPAWVVAMADGPVVRTGNGAVVQDLDGDGIEQTGWTILYMHIAAEGRAELGAYLHAGDRIGHPSCEGGVSNGTHTHLARRYNGEWIAADGPVPFNIDGWVSSGNGIEYDGYLTRNEQNIEAWDGRTPANQIVR